MILPNQVLIILILALGHLQSYSLGSQAGLSTFTMDEPNPPVWPRSVKIFRPTDGMDEIRSRLYETQDTWNEEYQTFTCDHHFSSRRYAILFAPGVYRGIDVEVGYYVQLAGLGRRAFDVKFIECEHGPYVPALNKHLRPEGTCLDSFWRSAENFYTDANMQWAVSQAAPLRRVHVGGDLILHDGKAYASGGHAANCLVDGHTYAGDQQQFLIRNVELGQGSSGGAWGMVYVGCSGEVPVESRGNETQASVTVLDTPRVRVEKPYIAMKEDGIRFELRVPVPLRGSGSLTVGPLLNGEHEEVRDFSRVRVIHAEEQAAARIQEALDEGKDVVLTPGIFHLEATLEIHHPNQVLLGLGLATLVAPTDGSPCIHIAPQVPGVRIGGVMLEASERDKNAEGYSGPSSLLEWGVEGSIDPGDAARPGALFDIFCRVGGATTGNRTNISIDTMMRIHSGHVIGDNLWLWRADHADLGVEVANYPHISDLYWQTEEHEYRVETGIEVFGDDVTMHGLAVEHANGHQTVWSGERGAVHFYQCEFPYGVSREFGENGFRGYFVKENVKQHEVHSPGIYSNFRNDHVQVSTAIEHPEVPGVKCINPFTVKLDNQGVISSIVNGKGGTADQQGVPIRME